MPRYERAPDDVYALVADVMQQYHEDLAEAGVTVETLFALPSDRDISDDGELLRPLVAHHGYPAAAVVKVVSAKDRAAGNADARLVIDGHQWESDWTDEQKVALLDHELTHLTLKRDKEGNILPDDNGRPKLKMRLHDVEVGTFTEVCRRHGDASIDLRQLRDVSRRYEQGEFDYAGQAAEAVA